MGDAVDRVPTGIIGFDNLCQGGFVRNSSNVIVGGPGSGKTTFLLQFLWNGANKFNENGLYCSFEPDIVDTVQDAMTHGWNFSKLNEENRIKFLKFSPHTSLEDLKSELTKVVSKFDIKRVCFDPVSVLTLNSENQGKIREIIFEIASLMKRMKVTSLLADETIDDHNMYSERRSWSQTDVLRFLTDGVVFFFDVGVQDVSDRSLQISKMRRTNHERKLTGMNIRDNGIEVVGV